MEHFLVETIRTKSSWTGVNDFDFELFGDNMLHSLILQFYLEVNQLKYVHNHYYL